MLHTHTHRDTHRQTDTQTDTHTRVHHRDKTAVAVELEHMEQVLSNIPSIATCAAVTTLLSTRSSVLYLTGAAETTPVAAGGLKAHSMYAVLLVNSVGRVLWSARTCKYPSSRYTTCLSNPSPEVNDVCAMDLFNA